MRKKTILFGGYAPVHFVCFKPIYDALVKIPGVEIFLTGGLRVEGRPLPAARRSLRSARDKAKGAREHEPRIVAALLRATEGRMKLQAILLAAGTGSRIAEVSDGRPKPLLEVGGKTLIEHQLDVLADSGIGPVTIVVGYKGDEVRKVVGNRADYVENPDPAGTNSLHSFWLARERIQGPILVCNCDLLYHPEIIDRLLDVKGSALAYDSSFGWGREKMKVGIVEGRVKAMSKSLPYGRATGENVSLICLTDESFL